MEGRRAHAARRRFAAAEASRQIAWQRGRGSPSAGDDRASGRRADARGLGVCGPRTRRRPRAGSDPELLSLVLNAEVDRWRDGAWPKQTTALRRAIEPRYESQPRTPDDRDGVVEPRHVCSARENRSKRQRKRSPKPCAFSGSRSRAEHPQIGNSLSNVGEEPGQCPVNFERRASCWKRRSRTLRLTLPADSHLAFATLSRAGDRADPLESPSCDRRLTESTKTQEGSERIPQWVAGTLLPRAHAYVQLRSLARSAR